MKTYAPKSLRGSDLRAMLADLCATPAEIAKFLQVTERSVFRWLADESAPFAVLAALWHETPAGRHSTALDVGNELAIYYGLARSLEDKANHGERNLARVLAISDTGAANDPLLNGPLPLHGQQTIDSDMRVPRGLRRIVGLDMERRQIGLDGGVDARRRAHHAD